MYCLTCDLPLKWVREVPGHPEVGEWWHTAPPGWWDRRPDDAAHWPHEPRPCPRNRDERIDASIRAKAKVAAAYREAGWPVPRDCEPA